MTLKQMAPFVEVSKPAPAPPPRRSSRIEKGKLSGTIVGAKELLKPVQVSPPPKRASKRKKQEFPPKPSKKRAVEPEKPPTPEPVVETKEEVEEKAPQPIPKTLEEGKPKQTKEQKSLEEYKERIKQLRAGLLYKPGSLRKFVKSKGKTKL